MPRYKIEVTVVTTYTASPSMEERTIEMEGEGVDSFDALIGVIRQIRAQVGALETLHTIHVGRAL